MNDSPPPLLLNRAAVGLSLLFLGCIPLFAANFRFERTDGSPFAGDFLQEYLGAYLILHGDRERFYDLDYARALQHNPEVMGMSFGEERFLPIIYPPFYYLLLAPLALMSFHTAALLWFVLMSACLLTTVWLLARAYPEHPALPAWALAGALFCAPLLENLNTSQKGTVALLILTATFLQLKQGRPFLAGLIFGLLAFKPQLTILIALAMLCKRQWWFVLGGACTGAVLVGLSLLVSPTACAQYLEISRNMADYINTEGFPLEKMHCWYGFFKLLLSGQEMTTIQWATAAASAITIAVLARLLWAPFAVETSAFAVQFAGMVIATVLLSPHLLTYDLTLLLLPFFLLTHVLRTQPSLPPRWRNAMIGVLILLYIACGFSVRLAALTQVQATVVLLFVLLVLLARMTRFMQNSSGLHLAHPLE